MARIPSEVLEHFANVPLFRGVSKRGLRALASAADELTVKPGTDLVRQGDHDRQLFVLVSGTASVYKGRRKIATIGPGDFVGELALLSGGPRTATVTTESEARVLVLGPREFDVTLDREPTVTKAILRELASRIRRMEDSPAH